MSVRLKIHLRWSPLHGAQAEGGAPAEKRGHKLVHSVHLDNLAGALHSYASTLGGGRSYLISGHRGAGKTTLAHAAIKRANQSSNRQHRRLMTVHLNGPDLFAAAPEAGAGPLLLRPLTAALCREVTREYIEALWAHLQASDPAPKSKELALLSLLRTRVESSVTLSDLHIIWDRLGVPDSGLLHAEATRADSRLLEIEVLWRNLQIHQIVAGTSSVQLKQSTDQGRSIELSASVKEKLNQLFPSAWALLTGGLASMGLAVSGLGPAPAVAGGFVAALFAATTLSITASSNRSASQSQVHTFTLDRTLKALPRLLPELVAQLREVGLSPVFVVDELDKLESVPEQMAALVRNLKSFVTEQSFFMFLVDRSYFEHLEWRFQNHAYPVEYTYFTERLFVSYQPEELHKYLNGLIGLEERASGDTPASGGAAQWTAIAADPSIKDVVRCAILHRSRMHLFSLRQELRRQAASDVEAETLAALREKIIEDPAWVCPVVLQLAVEDVLSMADLQHRFRSSRHFAQLALDAVYYPSQCWEKGETLDLRPHVWLDWLAARRADGLRRKEGELFELSPSDIDLLTRALDRLVENLTGVSEQQRLLCRLNETFREVEGEETRCIALQHPLLQQSASCTRCYEWLFTAQGLSTSLHRSQQRTAKLLAQHEQLRGLDDVLSEQLGADGSLWGLEQVGFLPQEPGWLRVKVARERLQAAPLRPYPELEADQACLESYAQGLEQASPQLTTALLWATVLRALSGASREAAWDAVALRLSPQVLGDDRGVHKRFTRWLSALRAGWELPAAELLHIEDALAVCAKIPPLTAAETAALQRRARRQLQRQLETWAPGEASSVVSPLELLSVLCSWPATGVFAVPLREMTVAQWGQKVLPLQAHPALLEALLGAMRVEPTPWILVLGDAGDPLLTRRPGWTLSVLALSRDDLHALPEGFLDSLGLQGSLVIRRRPEDAVPAGLPAPVRQVVFFTGEEDAVFAPKTIEEAVERSGLLTPREES